VEFDVVEADPAWQQQTLGTAVATLNVSGSSDAEKTAALRTLRFLDTPASIHELAFRLGRPGEHDRWEELAGLAGSRDQSLVVEELEQRMSFPDAALTSEYLNLLAKLKMQREQEPLPPYPETDPEQQKVWRKRAEKYAKEIEEQEDSLYERAGTLVATKTREAKSQTIRTLVEGASSVGGEVKPLAGLPPEEIAAAFLDLPPDQRWLMIMSFWNRLKSPAMSAALKKIA
jgi:hypothetical protein